MHRFHRTFLGYPILLAAILAAMFLIGWVPPPVAAQTPIGDLEAYDFDDLSITTAPTGFTAAKISPASGLSAKAAACTVETQAARVREDGVDPSSTVGLLWPTTTISAYTVVGVNNVRRFRAIATTGTTKLECTLYR